jgi:hypothetical protein
MIYSAKILEGFATKLPALSGEREFLFTPHVNILCGENGTGKSTLIRALAAYCCVPNRGGIPRFIEPGDMGCFGGNMNEYPHACKGLTGITADVDWNGSLTVLYNPSEGDLPLRGFEVEDSDGLLGSKGDIGQMFSKPSEGQKRVSKILAIESKLIENPNFIAKPTSCEKNYDKMNDTWREAFDRYVAYVESCRAKHASDQRPTLLLDEPDRSLSIAAQCAFWTSFIPRLQKSAQIIIASHSPLSLFTEGAMLIDMKFGYSAKATEHIERLVAGKPIELPPESEESKQARAAFLSSLKD